MASVIEMQGLRLRVRRPFIMLRNKERNKGLQRVCVSWNEEQQVNGNGRKKDLQKRVCVSWNERK